MLECLPGLLPAPGCGVLCTHGPVTMSLGVRLVACSRLAARISSMVRRLVGLCVGRLAVSCRPTACCVAPCLLVCPGLACSPWVVLHPPACLFRLS